MFVPSVRRCAPGFWRNTTSELKRATKFALNLEGLHLPLTPYPIFDFADPETTSTLKTMTDQSVGGFSTAELTQKPADASSNTPAHILFRGNISTKLPANRPDINRTGYAAWRNQDRGRTLWGELMWNVDTYMYLALRVKSDGRKYFVNVQTDSIVESDIHQHRLYTKHHKGAEGTDDPGQWETVWIKLHEFVRTNHGVVTEPQSEMLRQKVKSFGIGLIDRQPGPFELGIAAMWATNLNERGQVDGRTGWEDGDQGSARLGEVTAEKLAQKEEEKRNMPVEKKSFRERVPHFGKVGTQDRSGMR
ncbi:complex I intermediate-associated protein 30-domain-containing protein [Exophiala viscosa]|uniref:Complex I intermediate-associated protein 30-domain-containing protein n=1 Tax=Exophiala viscosa TaxID=2486360 RepID=A0AAN6DVK9_9EURO|nr:complex I intermediate-associated protein 30-domain-containing protein [Exophiala viscosa]KAI1626094.1 complex I intermediate-associated protein 30-domain-containing protein [Exophiala viscosa]